MSEGFVMVGHSARRRLVKLIENRDVGGLSQALLDGDPSIRASAAKALGEIGDPAATDPLAGALSDEHPEVRNYVIEALAAIRDPRALAALLHELQERRDSSADPVRRSIVDRLAMVGDSGVDAIVEAVESDRIVRSDATTVLGSMRGSDKAAQGLVHLLERDAAGTGRANYSALTVKALGQIGSPVAIDAMAKLMTDATDPWTRAMALDLLGRGQWKPRDVREAVWAELVRIEDASGKSYHGEGVPRADPYSPWTATSARALLSAWGTEVMDHVFVALDRDSDDFVRPECVAQLLWGLADQLDEQAIGPLARLANGSDPDLAYYATCALVNMASDDVVPVLQTIARTSRAWRIQKIVGTETLAGDDIFPVSREVKVDNVSQREIAEAEWRRRTSQPHPSDAVDERTAEIKSATGATDVAELVKLLSAALHRNDRKAADKTIRSLEKVGGRDVAALLGGLRDETPTIRWAVTQLLGKVGGPDVIRELRTTLQDPDEGVREAAQVAIERIESRTKE